MIKPFGNNILIKVPEKEKITQSGIVIPDSAEQEKPENGEVVAVGSKVKSVKPGDTVLFAKYSAIDIEFENEEFLIITELDILAGVDED